MFPSGGILIEIKGVNTIDGTVIDVIVESPHNKILQAGHLHLFPCLIDPHVHFRVPGQEHKEDWKTASKAAIFGGIGTVFDMPNNQPPCTTHQALKEKKHKIAHELREAGIPLHRYFYFGVDKNTIDEIPKVKGEVIGLKVFMGSSTGSLLIDDDETLDKVFSLAKDLDLIVAVHAEDEKMIQERKKTAPSSYSAHSIVRSPEVAAAAIKKAIALVRKYKTRLYILHVSSDAELNLIRAAKKEGLPVYAECCPHHLFLNDQVYEKLHGKAVVNPPLRSEKDRQALWDAIDDETIDTIGSDHAPHTIEEKRKPYGSCPSGMPGVETLLPLLLNAYHMGKISFARIASLTSGRVKEIFRLPPDKNVLLVDLERVKKVDDSHLKTKVKWSPFAGETLKGWPAYIILNGEFFDVSA